MQEQEYLISHILTTDVLVVIFLLTSPDEIYRINTYLITKES